MCKNLMIEFLIISLCLLLNIICIKSEGKVSIEVKPKQFNGFLQKVEEKEVNVFLGIPYAKPPIGELRFKKPVAYEYEKPINAYQWGNPCSQIKFDLNVMPFVGNQNFSEDCLYLNVWSPVDSDGKNSLKPVLFWIHGGGLTIGASNWVKTEGEVLAAKGDVVVVSINYRLKTFGFLYTGTDDAPGNVGLWDQAMALKWVNEYIRYFGGDPNLITIFGESAGSLSVSLHLLSPITRNLFKNAVMMSGGALSDFVGDKDSVRDMWSEMAASLNCKEDFDGGSAQCLRNLNGDNFTNSKLSIDTQSSAFVVYGDEFLPKKAIEMFRTGDYKKNVNLLMGTTDDEGSILLSSFIDKKKFSITNPANISKSESKKYLNSLLSKIFAKAMINSEDVYNIYVSQLPEDNYNAIRRSMGVALGDYLLTCPTIEFGKLLFNGDRNRSKVFQYLWSAKFVNTWHGADHASEVEYVFGSPFRENNSDENKRRISQKWIETLSYFAKHGKPAPQEDIEWKSYYTIRDKLITPYYEFANDIRSEGNFGTGFKYECNKLWKKYIIDK